jgi:glutathione S-transferase
VARFLNTYSGRPDWYEARRAELQKRGVAALEAMERHLDSRTWFVGDAMTLADISLFAYTHSADEGGFDLGPHAAVRAWLERVAEQPGHVPIHA